MKRTGPEHQEQKLSIETILCHCDFWSYFVTTLRRKV